MNTTENVDFFDHIEIPDPIDIGQASNDNISHYLFLLDQAEVACLRVLRRAVNTLADSKHQKNMTKIQVDFLKHKKESEFASLEDGERAKATVDYQYEIVKSDVDTLNQYMATIKNLRTTAQSSMRSIRFT